MGELQSTRTSAGYRLIISELCDEVIAGIYRNVHFTAFETAPPRNAVVPTDIGSNHERQRKPSRYRKVKMFSEEA